MPSTRINLVIFALFLLLPNNLYAAEWERNHESLFKNWFVGGAINLDCVTRQEEETMCGNTKFSGQLSAGYQFNKYFRFLASYNPYDLMKLKHNNNIRGQNGEFIPTRFKDVRNAPYSLALRSQWVFESNFLIYFDTSINFEKIARIDTSIETNKVIDKHTFKSNPIGVGGGIGYWRKHHEVDFGFDFIDFNDNDGHEAKFSLQYFYHF